ncbi:methyltransferase domain-containing protein [Actinomadura sp. ATCC 31491]|uniref:Methyltransferase domain-containing protein n=1 Tax=Actinomadura luzonensis TaxID=2805427 RepID=A0ABT0G2Q3_9ACTN|nr:methyltransferase [Actinomadura luzonensis]MCK2218882.1 methyltransferase domain-containing protein [Actinomadura luzonensis]
MTDERAPRVQDVLDAFTMYSVLQAAVRLSVPDLLAAGPRTVSGLADGVAAATEHGRPDERLLARLLRALHHLRLVERDESGRYSLTEEGALLTTGRPDSLAPQTLIWGEELWRESAHLLHRTIATGEAAALGSLGHASPYAYLQARPAAARLFQRLMRGVTVTVARALTEEPLPPGRVADIGGGTGALLTTLAAAHPGLRATLFELPEVAAQALETLGQETGIEVVAGDMFTDPLPQAGLYVLSNVLHNYDDARVAALLARVADAMAPGGLLWIVDGVLEDDPVRSTTASAALDVMMLTLFAGGQERTIGELGELLAGAGLAVVRTRPLPHGRHLVVARPA